MPKIGERYFDGSIPSEGPLKKRNLNATSLDKKIKNSDLFAKKTKTEKEQNPPIHIPPISNLTINSSSPTVTVVKKHFRSSDTTPPSSTSTASPKDQAKQATPRILSPINSKPTTNNLTQATPKTHLTLASDSPHESLSLSPTSLTSSSSSIDIGDLKISINKDDEIREYQETFQTDCLLQIGENLVCPIASCTGSSFLENINRANQDRDSLDSSPFIALRDLPDSESLSPGINNTQLLRAVTTDGHNENIGIVKPALENFMSELEGPWEQAEQQRTGIPYTQMVRNEWLASFLSGIYSKAFNLDFGVPETHILTIPSSNFSNLRSEHTKNTNMDMICSIHKFVPNTTNLGTASSDFLKNLPGDQISKVAILDILLYNTDRRRHNILVKDGTTLIPIDHSLIASAGFQDNARFFWLGVKSANLPLTEELRAGINKLEWKNIKEEILKANPNIDEATLNTLNTSLEFLKIGASLDMTLYEMGSLMFRKGDDFNGDFIHFAEHCYKEASNNKQGDFSENIVTEITKHLTPCAQLLKDPKYEALMTIPKNIHEGFRTPLLQAMMTALNDAALENGSFTDALKLETSKLNIK